jgi:hypothetical protein
MTSYAIKFMKNLAHFEHDSQHLGLDICKAENLAAGASELQQKRT